MTRNQYPIYEGEMQRRLDAALEHLSHAWGAARRAGIAPPKLSGWPPSPDDYKEHHNNATQYMLYTLAAATTYVYETWVGMRQQWGDDTGQLCPYDDCAFDLALPHEGWWTCGRCLRDFWCQSSDGIEDYHCYRPGEAKQEQPKPETVPVARVLGPSWASKE